MEHKEVEIRIKRIVRWQERLASAALGETAPLEVQYLPEAADAGAPPPRARSARESAERRPLAAPPVPEATGPEQPGVRPRPVSCLDPLLDFPFRIPGAGAPWRPMREGEAWGRAWDRAWFRLHGRVPAAWAGRRIVAHIDLGSEGLVLRADGTLLQGITTGSIWEPSFKRDVVPLYERCTGGEEVDLLVEATAASLFGVFTEPDPADDSPDRYGRYEGLVRRARLARFDPETWGLALDLRVLLGLVRRLPEKSVRRARLIHAASAAADRFAGMPERAAECRALLAPELFRPAEPSAPRVVAVGHAHIDTAWLWPVEETVRKCARTFAAQVELLRRYPEYVFGASQAQHYLFVKERHPQLYAEIRRLVAERRWEVQGGMWVEADCNLIDGESMVRQILHGKRFFREEFGVEVENLWLPDVFGYSAALPQILRRSGIDAFLTQKLSWNQWNDFPHTTFRWRGIDGSEVLAHFPPENTYNSPLDPEALLPGAENFREKGYLEEFLSLFGVGDGGGGPKEEHLETGRRCADLEGSPRVSFGRADAFFARLRERADQLPVWSGELYLELHRGTLTSQAAVKRGNRACEQRLRAVELLWSMRPLEEYPAAALDRLWKTLLLHQFHDILPGTSITRAYGRTREAHAAIQREAAALIAEAGERLFPSDPGALTLFDPHETAFDGVVELPGDCADGAKASDGAGGRGEAGTPGAASSAACRLQSEEGALVAAVRIPAFTFVEVRPAGAPPPVACAWRPVSADPDRLRLENGLVRYEFGPSGALRRGWDEEAEREILPDGAAGNLLTLYEDRPNDWDAWDVDLFAESAVVGHARGLGCERLEMADAAARGRPPVRQGLRFRLAIGESEVTQTVFLPEGSRRLDFVTEVDWRERHRWLRVLFPVAVEGGEATHEVQYGRLRRPTHANTSWERARFEVAAQRWVDLSSADYGAALLNDGKYGHRVRENRLELSLLRAPTYPDPDCDRGRHRFTYAFLPHPGPLDGSPVVADALALNLPPILLRGRSLPPGAERAAGTGRLLTYPVRVEGDGLRLAVVKRSEDGRAWILRVVETLGRRTSGRLAFGSPGTLQPADLLEREIGPPAAARREFAVTLEPFEIRTYAWTR